MPERQGWIGNCSDGLGKLPSAGASTGNGISWSERLDRAHGT